MEDWAEIRRLHRAEGVSISEIARRMGLARNTVKAAPRSERPPKYLRPARGRPRPRNRRLTATSRLFSDVRAVAVDVASGPTVGRVSGGERGASGGGESVKSIGELARSTGLTTRTLRHYDHLGLLRPSSRSAAGHRCYSPDDVRRLHRIVALRSFGLPLDDVAAVLSARPDHDPAELLHRHLTAVDERIKRAARVRARLLSMLDALRRLDPPTTTQFLDLIEETTAMDSELYDTIGATYTLTRRTDPHIAADIWAALGDARTVLNVGAGTGSYEPPDRDVTAVEPSKLMRAQRPADAAPSIAGSAAELPFDDQSFDAAMAVATIHHWPDPIAGLLEMRRVARRVVVFTHDTSHAGWLDRFWLTRDYLPEVGDLLTGRPPIHELADAIGARIAPILIPWDCHDGFFEAYWRRPEAYLDETVRNGISVWGRVGPAAERRAVADLGADLHSGRWRERNHDLLDLESADLGLRLLIA